MQVVGLRQIGWMLAAPRDLVLQEWQCCAAICMLQWLVDTS